MKPAETPPPPDMDPEDQAIVMIDEIGSDAEVKRAKCIMKKSRGRSSDLLHESLHLLAAGWNRGPIISGGKDTATEKMKALEATGVKVEKNPAEIGHAVKKALGR